MRTLLVILCLAAACSSWSVWAQKPPPVTRRVQSDGPLRSITDAQGRRTTILSENVRITRQDLTARADSAWNYEWRSVFRLLGSVSVDTDSLDLWADELFLHEKDGVAVAIGSVRVQSIEGSLGRSQRGHYRRDDDWLALAGKARVIDEGLVVDADSISIDRRAGILRAFGAVRVVDEINHAVVTGERGVFDRRAGIAVIDSIPHLVSRRQGSEATEVDSRWMAFDRRLGRSTAIGDVRFRQGLTRATADTAHFLGETIMLLSGAPVVDQEQRRITGSFIRILYQMGRLREMDVYGDALLEDSSPDTLESEFRGIPLRNTLAGDTLRVFLENGEISRTTVRGNASSTYLPEDQVRSISVNEVSGNAIDISFRDRLVDRVDVRGGVQGRYRFLDRARFFDPDSTAVDSVGIDSLAVVADSLAVPAQPDSTRLVDFGGRADEVRYSGNLTEFLVGEGRIHIDGHAQVEHGTLVLDAEDVHFDTESREMMAEGDPHLVDRESELVGERMGYLFEPQTGAVSQGATRFDDGYYTGKHIRRVDKKTLLVGEGTFSTCDLAEPHYHFSAKKMKLKVGERVVARQVTLKVSNIPLVTLPFYYKNLTKGRRSGILFPSVNLGVSSREGRYIKDFGYYWATNDYTDLKMLADWNERKDLALEIENRYNVRYGVRGNVRMDWLRRFSENESGDQWAFRASHVQPELFDVWSGQADLYYTSSTITRSDIGSNSTTQLLPKSIKSSGRLGRRFDNGANLSLSMERTQQVNVDDDDLTTALVRQTLPSASLSFRTLPLMPPARAGRNASLWLQPLRDTTFSQSYRGSWSQERYNASGTDTWALNGSFGLSYAPAKVGPLKWTSGASYGDGYRWKRIQQDSVAFGDSTKTDIVGFTATEEDRNRSLSFNNRIGTDVYGFLRTPIGPVRALKHKITLSASHRLSPAIRDQQNRSQSYSFNVTQDFSLKLREDGKPVGEDGEIPTRKIDQVLTWDLGTSWNPDATPDARWSNISSRMTVRSPVPAIRSLQITQSIDPYEWEIESTRINSGFTLRGGIDLGGSISKREEVKNTVIDRLPALADSTDAAADSLNVEAEDFFEDIDDRDDPFDDPAFREGSDRNVLPWSFGSSLGFTRTRQSDGSNRVTANVSMNASLRLPGEWSLTWRSSFDAERGQLVNQNYTLSRTLHRWTLNFQRSVAGDGSDFGFQLFLSDIPDLEIKRGRDRDNGLGRLSQF